MINCTQPKIYHIFIYLFIYLFIYFAASSSICQGHQNTGQPEKLSQAREGWGDMITKYRVGSQTVSWDKGHEGEQLRKSIKYGLWWIIMC
jgi:hypothetical protein